MTTKSRPTVGWLPAGPVKPPRLGGATPAVALHGVAGLLACEDRVQHGCLGLLDRGVGEVDGETGVRLGQLRSVLGLDEVVVALPLVGVLAHLRHVVVPGPLLVVPPGRELVALC